MKSKEVVESKMKVEEESDKSSVDKTQQNAEVEHTSERPSVEEQLKLRRPRINVWSGVCREIKTEMHELDLILTKLGLPPHNFHRDRSYPYNDYETIPNPKTCFAKDFADYHVFPFLLPAVQSLILFSRKNRVFQCRYCIFNALDYMVEYLYNNNPRYPERAQQPVPLHEIPFAKEWLEKYPREPYPKWLTMTDQEAALIIQRAVRGYLVRKRPDVQEMRQFWRDYKKDMEEERNRKIEPPSKIFSPLYESELSGEEESERRGPPFVTHSDYCNVCIRFRDFIHRQELYRLSLQSSEASSLGSLRDNEDEETSNIMVSSSQKLKSDARQTSVVQ